MKTKNGDNSINTITIKRKEATKFSQLFVKTAKKPARKKHKFVKSKPDNKVKLFGRALVFVMMIPLMFFAYIYIEGTAQAGTDRTGLSRMQIVYNYYNSQASQNKVQIIRNILLGNGLRSDLCTEVAETIVEESNKTDIPVEMYLAIMKKESTFRSYAVSSASAKGIMQIQGGTWNAYIDKHNIPVSKKDIFVPRANIMVASVILKELYDYYAKRGYQEDKIWDYVLAAYLAGPASVKNGIQSYHWQYIDKVKEYSEEFQSQIAT